MHDRSGDARYLRAPLFAVFQQTDLAPALEQMIEIVVVHCAGRLDKSHLVTPQTQVGGDRGTGVAGAQN